MPLAGCGGSRPATEHVTIRVKGSAESTPKEGCFLFLTAQVVGEGNMLYCLEEFTGRPGPNAVVKDSGTMTFVLADGTLRAKVRIAQSFEDDGRHAQQELTGALTGGTGRFTGASGTITGGGTVDEHPPGRVAHSDLRYTVTLEG